MELQTPDWKCQIREQLRGPDGTENIGKPEDQSRQNHGDRVAQNSMGRHHLKLEDRQACALSLMSPVREAHPAGASAVAKEVFFICHLELCHWVLCPEHGNYGTQLDNPTSSAQCMLIGGQMTLRPGLGAQYPLLPGEEVGPTPSNRHLRAIREQRVRPRHREFIRKPWVRLGHR